MDTKVQQCTQYKREVELYHRTCEQDLCISCKKKHLLDLDTKYHDVVIDRLRHDDFIIHELGNCETHQAQRLNKLCLSCKRPICAECDGHQNHEILDIKSFQRMVRRLYMERIVQIRTEILPNNRVILANIKSDLKIVMESKLADFELQKKRIEEKTCQLKDLTDLVIKNRNRLKRLLKSRLKEAERNIANIQLFIYSYEQLFIKKDKKVHFLSYVKKNPYPKVKAFHATSNFFLSKRSELKIEDTYITKLLLEITIDTKERQVSYNKQLLELMPSPVLKKSFPVREKVLHMSYATTDMMWISDQYGKIILTNTTDVPSCILFNNMNTVNNTGGHCVTREGNLLYIDEYHYISKLSTEKMIMKNDLKMKLINVKEPWVAKCVYSSPSNGDILVGILRYEKDKNKPAKAKVVRYISTGKKHIQVIGDENTDQRLYEHPLYITENHNGDVIVSDQNRAVVVTDRKGKHRFSYAGPPQEEKDEFSFTGHLSTSQLLPLGLCVDALSNILVSDANSKTIQMIDKDGHFLSLLFTEQRWKKAPRALSYNNKNHLLLVGTSDHNEEICIYRYIQRKEVD
ncbi:uncharacterized protein LOC134263263 [Saccostrea cucullata]|uniref:uncharacterized protein LOC134263263 n=1 Tax=Saccostrea cuccullata TaxID=36930 RepID=UPI002ED549C8